MEFAIETEIIRNFIRRFCRIILNKKIYKMLKINNLHAKIEDGVEILKGINLEIKPGEVHAIIKPNGAGKFFLL